MMLIAVALGGAVGAVLRYGIGLACLALWGTGFPIATMLVNIVGSFLMGVFASYLTLTGIATQEIRGFLTIGLLGAFTTFSAFSMDAVTLWERGLMTQAIGYVILSILLSIGALVAGMILTRHILT